MRKNNIYAFNTHYEIYDYSIGDNPKLERALTYRDRAAHTDYPKYLYDKEERTLYIPRGYNSMFLEEWNGKPVTIVDNDSNDIRTDYMMVKPPRDENEEKAIRFLVGEGEFSGLRLSSQKVLIMAPGMGKTYCTIAAIQKLHTKSLIIMRTQSLKEQWFARYEEYTNLGGPNMVDIDSSEFLHSLLKKKPSRNQKVFIVTRRLLISYCEKYGVDSLQEVLNHIGIGVKVFDEAHQEYAMTLLIDYFTNVKRTFYLTATFHLSSYGNRDTVFQTAFYKVPKLQLRQSDDARHIIYIAVLFNSHPNAVDIARVTGGKRKYNKYAYVDYELSKGILEKEVRSLISFFLNEKEMSGKTLILSSKKATCDFFKEIADDETDRRFNVCSFYTGNKVDNYKSYDIITATSGMLGTGEDIPGLRFMHNTEPGSSLPNTDQFSGRLRPFEGGNKPTFYIEYVDVGFDRLYDWYRSRSKLLKTKVKECKELNHIGGYGI